MLSPANDIKNILVTNAIGVYGTNLFIYREPADVNDCVTLYDLMGVPIEETDCISEVDKFRIQVRVRNSNPVNCYNKLKDIEGVLNYLTNTYAGTTLYAIIYRIDTGYFLEIDEKNRVVFVQNYEGMRQLP